MSRKIHFDLHAKLPVLIKKDDGWYVASCPILDVVTQGKTEKSAMKNIKEALSLFFISCLERGTLDQVLKNCGAKVLKKSVTKTVPIPREYHSVDIPIPLTANLPHYRGNPVACHA